MSTGKVLSAANSSFSLSGGFRSIFYCCFASSSSSSKNNSAKEAESERKEEAADKAVGYKGRQGAGEGADTGDKDVGEAGRVDGREEELSQTNGVRDPSEQDSAVCDEFLDSAIDCVSVNSQFNLRGSVDGETMKTSDSLDPYEENCHYGNQNDYVTKQDATQGEQESNEKVTDDYPASAFTSVERIETGEGQGAEGEAEGDKLEVDANIPPFAQTEVDRMDPEAGKLEDAINNADLAHPAVIQCGRVRLTFSYDAGHQRLTLTVHEASDIPDHDRVNLSHSQVHLLLLPATKKIRHKTKAKTGENPQFEDTFRIKIPMDELRDDGLRLRLYRTEKFKKERMIGEKYLAFSSLPLDDSAQYSTWVKLQPRININIIGNPTLDDADEMSRDDVDGIAASSPSVAAAATLASGPSSEVRLGMTYNATTGRLSVEVVQGCNIKSPDSQKPPDTYVKLRLIAPNGQEIARSKTTMRRGQPNPLYKETFMFHVPQFQLPDISLMVSVFEHRNMKHNKMLGWFTLGHTNSTEETKKHWMAMIESKGEQIARWHTLLNP